MILEKILDYIIQHKRKFILLTIALLLAAFGWVIYTSITRAGKIAVEVHVVPGDATVRIDNQKATGFLNFGTAYVTPGNHSVIVEKDGYAAFKSDMTFDKDRTLIVKSLLPVSDTAKDWAKKHQDDYSQNEKYGAQKAKQDGQFFFKNNPIAAKLPVKDPYYTIGYKTDGDTISLTINTPSPRYRYFAIKQLRSMGYDPADYKIIFTDYKNPLETK